MSHPPATDSQVRFLDFLVIGASKSGTTALFRYLRTDPELYLPPDKDAPFFAVDEHYQAGWPAFAEEFFSEAPDEALWGTVTPRYMEDPRVPARIAATMPEIKLIALLRNPIDRAFSQYRQQVRRGKESRSFEKVVDELLGAAPGGGEGLERILSPGRYGETLARFAERFPPERLLVLFTEELEARPQAVIDTIRSFLGLPPGFSPPNLSKRYHVGGDRRRFPGLIPALQRIAPLRWLWHRLPRATRRSLWVWFFTQLDVVRGRGEQIPAPVRRQLVEHYREDVEHLAALTGREAPWSEFREG